MKARLYLKNQVPLTFEGDEIILLKRECDYDIRVDMVTRVSFNIDEFSHIIWDEKDFPELRTKDSA